MSYASLIADADHAQSGREQFLDEIVLLVVECRAAEVRDFGGLHQRLAIPSFLKRTLPRFPYSVCHHVHGLLKVDLFPSLGIGRPVLNLGQAIGMRMQL